MAVAPPGSRSSPDPGTKSRTATTTSIGRASGRDRSRLRVESQALLDRGLEGLLSHAVPDGGPSSAGSPPDHGPLVIIDPAGGGATRAIDNFFLERSLQVNRLRQDRLGAALPPLPDVATIWAGRSLGQTIARALATGRLDRLTAVFLARPVAIIDDVDRLGSREIQAAFVHLFDTATNQGIGLCLSVARYPTALDALDPNIVSRLASGLVLRPRSAAPEARFNECRNTSVSLGRVLRAVARHHDLDVATLVGPSRRRAIVEARSLAMYLARVVTGRSLKSIGAACGGRDHTTALHATRTQAARIAANPALAADVERMVDQFVKRLSETREPRGRQTPDIGLDNR